MNRDVADPAKLIRASRAGVHVPSAVIDKTAAEIQPNLEFSGIDLKAFPRKNLRTSRPIKIGMLKTFRTPRLGSPPVTFSSPYGRGRQTILSSSLRTRQPLQLRLDT